MGVRRLAVANGPNIFQMILVIKLLVTNKDLLTYIRDRASHAAVLQVGGYSSLSNG